MPPKKPTGKKAAAKKVATIKPADTTLGEGRMSISAYARQRGITDEAVRYAIKTGRLKQGHGRTESGRPYIVPEVADREWAANTDPTATRDTITGTRATAGTTPTEGLAPLSLASTANESKQYQEYYKAELLRLEFEEKTGRLVKIEDVRATVEAEYTAIRQRFLGLPSKLCAELALLDEAAAVRDTLRAAIEGVLHELTADAGEIRPAPKGDEQP